MKNKVLKILCVISIVVILVLIGYILYQEKLTDWIWFITFGLGYALDKIIKTCIDLTDNVNWKETERKLLRAKIVNKDTQIRISFAYLFRIKVNGKYLLVKNARNTGKYQPVGGVYKMSKNEANELSKRYFVENDKNISVDAISKQDYRLHFKMKFLRKFFKRFNKTMDRENIANLSREFKEELLDTKILPKKSFNKIQYRYCGRDITDLHFSDHFATYEILLADIVEIELTTKQEEIMDRKYLEKSADFIFATQEEIERLGVGMESEKLDESIADHSKKILTSNQSNLISMMKYKNKKFEVEL